MISNDHWPSGSFREPKQDQYTDQLIADDRLLITYGHAVLANLPLIFG